MSDGTDISDDRQREILSALADGPVSGAALAAALGVSRTAIWKRIEHLRDVGFRIEGAADGYRVVDAPAYGALAVEYGLRAPYRIEYHEAVESTNARARELAHERTDEVVILANEQTAGRGRTDRQWASPPGGVWASVVVRPTLPPARISVLTLAGALAAARATREAGVEARIKWPNDVVVPDPEFDERGGRKLAGILTELEGEADRVEWAVVGIGVNANVSVDVLPSFATSLREAVGDVDRRVFVQRLLEEFHRLAAAPDETLAGWRELECTIGRQVAIEAPGGVIRGLATSVTETGALVVDDGSDTRTVFAGDCRHLRF